MRSERLDEAMKAFARVERGIVEFGMAGDTQHAVELIRLRKQMITEFAALSAALEADPFLAERREAKTDLLRLFSAFRTANALNTAEWPAIRVRDDVPSFRAAATSVGHASRAFWRRIEQELPLAA